MRHKCTFFEISKLIILCILSFPNIETIRLASGQASIYLKLSKEAIDPSQTMTGSLLRVMDASGFKLVVVTVNSILCRNQNYAGQDRQE